MSKITHSDECSASDWFQNQDDLHVLNDFKFSRFDDQIIVNWVKPNLLMYILWDDNYKVCTGAAFVNHSM